MTVQERLNRIEEGTTCRHCEVCPKQFRIKAGLLRTYLAMTGDCFVANAPRDDESEARGGGRLFRLLLAA